MSTTEKSQPQVSQQPRALPNVLVATTAMLAFISFWRAAAIVLNDLGSSAYYAGGEAEGFIGKSAPNTNPNDCRSRRSGNTRRSVR